MWRRCVGCRDGARNERQDRDDRQYREVLEQQDAEGGTAVLRFELIALGQHLQNQRRGGQ
jgi:hypothetical protein